jgi:nucleoside-diphosphate-sugar epimerase
VSEEPTVRGRRVLVTGATGFVGSHVVRQLLRGGARVSAMSSSVSTTVPERLADVVDDIELVDANVCDVSSLAHAVGLSRPELVVHLAAFTHVGRSFYRVDENIQTNVQGTVNLLQALEGRFDRFVYVGTGDVYGAGAVPFREDQPVAPVSPYAVSKYAAERFCRMYHQANDWPIVCLRPFNTFGPWQSVDRVVPELIVSGLRGVRLPMTEGTQTREFTYVDDVAEAITVALVRPGVEGEIFNIGRGEETSVRELALTISALVGTTAEPDFGALQPRPNEIPRMVGDSGRARERLGWEAKHTLEDALTRTVDWYRGRLAGGAELLPS